MTLAPQAPPINRNLPKPVDTTRHPALFFPFRSREANAHAAPGHEGQVIQYVMISVRMKRGEPVEKALRRLKKIMDKEGMMKQLRANRYFEKPSDKKRRKAARARTRPS